MSICLACQLWKPSLWPCCESTYLVCLDRRNLLVLGDMVANLLAPLLQGALANGLGHLGDLDDLIGIAADLLELDWELSK